MLYLGPKGARHLLAARLLLPILQPDCRVIPAFGSKKVRKLTTMEIQEYFNTLSPGLSPKSVKLIHGTIRATLNQGKAWGMLDNNPAVGVKLPRKRAVKPTILLSLADIRRMIEGVKEPTKSMLILIV